MTVDTGIDKSSLSLKAIARRAKEEAKRTIANARLQVLSLEADMIQTARKSLDSTLESGKAQILARIKEETGLTPQEARYKALEAYRKAKETISDGKTKINQLKERKEARKKKELGDSYEAPLDTEMKVKPEESLEEMVKKMPVNLFNAFFLNEILEVVDKAKTIVAQAKELGPKAVDEVNGHIKFIQDNFKKGPSTREEKYSKVEPEVSISDDVYTADSSMPSYMASDSTDIDDNALNNSLLEDLAKSKASTTGAIYDYSDNKPMTPVANIALGMLTTVLPILEIIKHLAENWQTNKYGLLADSDERLNNVFMQNAKGEEVQASEVIDPLLDSIPGLRDTEEDDGSEDDEEPREDYLKDYAHVDYLPSNPTAFVSKTIPVYSELDRVYASLSLATKCCKYNEEFELISLSTPTDGGKVDNLRHAGNNKIELVDAIEAINEGERLLEAYEDPAYREWLDNLTPYKGGTSVGGGDSDGEDTGDYSYSGSGGSSGSSSGGENETGEENADLLEKYPELTGFLSIVTITDKDTETLAWLHALYGEAHSQFYDSKSENGLPYLYSSSNFPTIIEYYGSTTDTDQAFEAMRGWILAMALSELVPSKRDKLFKKGYNLGGDKDTPIYRYTFHSDPNIARLVASAVYATMRPKFSSKIISMRSELNGSKFSGNTHKYAEDSYVTNSSSFYISLNFLPSAPGPYVDGFTSRSTGEPYPGWSGKASDKNLTKDKEIYDYVVANYNLGSSSNLSRTIQAIADKEGEPEHLFGTNRTVGHYNFNPVFGTSNIGKTISSSGNIASLADDMFNIGSTARHALLDPNYGRSRPGGTNTDAKGQDGTGGILCDFDIENNDGCPTEYDKNGNLVVGKELNPGEFCDYSRNHLYANSYPSGHSAGIWNAALMLMEIMPDRADRIMRAANEFAMSRVIARYHWNSDTIVGRVLGSAINAVTHATSDYDDRLSSAKSEL